MELLVAILGDPRRRGDARSRAERLLEDVGGLTGMARATVPTLVEVGLEQRAAQRLAAAIELGRRAMEPAIRGAVIASGDAVARWARPRLVHLEHEELWVLLLDGRNRLRHAVRAAQGGLHACSLTPADVLRPAVRGAASALVLVHNHPSGDPTPSREDVAMTRAVAAACEVVAIPLLDHVIVARDGSSSLLEQGLLTSSR